jgi:hypothetical protein
MMVVQAAQSQVPHKYLIRPLSARPRAVGCDIRVRVVAIGSKGRTAPVGTAAEPELAKSRTGRPEWCDHRSGSLCPLSRNQVQEGAVGRGCGRTARWGHVLKTTQAGNLAEFRLVNDSRGHSADVLQWLG